MNRIIDLTEYRIVSCNFSYWSDVILPLVVGRFLGRLVDSVPVVEILCENEPLHW